MTDEINNSIVGESAILLEYAKSNVYRKNAFRITALSVTSTTAEIMRQTKVNEMRSKFGGKGDQIESPFPLNPPPSSEETSEALQRLKDPEKRLVDEFFWFWPRELGETYKDEALSSLSKNDANTAQRIWINYENQMSMNNVSMHNLAVLSHLLALDKEQETERELTPKEKLRRDTDWKDAFKRWKVLLTYEGFWSRLTERVKQMNDARLKTGTVRRMKESLPVALLQINGQLAVQYAEKGKEDEAQRHLNLMRSSGFDSPAIDSALKRAIEPLRERIKTMCKSAVDEAEKNQRKANLPAIRLIEYSKELLKIIDILLNKDDPLRESLYDDVALSVLSCELKYNHKTQDYRASLELLKSAKQIVKSSFNSDKIADNIKQLEEIIKNDFSWCIDGYWELPDACIDFLEDARGDEDSNSFGKAINKLSQALSGATTLPDHPSLENVIKHCISYTLKVKSIFNYNNSLDDYEGRLKETILNFAPYLESAVASLLLSNSGTYNYGISTLRCAHCNQTITGTYYTRMLKGNKVPFCTRCSNTLDSKLENLRGDHKIVIKDSLNLLILADYLIPNNKTIIRNLEIIRKAANDENIKADTTFDLLKKWNLLTYTEIIKLLSNKSSSEAQYFDMLKRIMMAGKNDITKKISKSLFAVAFKNDESVKRFLPFFISVDEIKKELIQNYFSANLKSSEYEQHVIIDYFNDSKDYKLLYKIMDQILNAENSKHKLVQEILTHFFESLYQLIQDCDTNNPAPTADKIIEIINPSAGFSPFLEERFLNTITDIIKYSTKNLNGNMKRLEEIIKTKIIIKPVIAVLS